jgi:hypothetical protein
MVVAPDLGTKEMSAIGEGGHFDSTLSVAQISTGEPQGTTLELLACSQ